MESRKGFRCLGILDAKYNIAQFSKEGIVYYVAICFDESPRWFQVQGDFLVEFVPDINTHIIPKKTYNLYDLYTGKITL